MSGGSRKDIFAIDALAGGWKPGSIGTGFSSATDASARGEPAGSRAGNAGAIASTLEERRRHFWLARPPWLSRQELFPGFLDEALDGFLKTELPEPEGDMVKGLDWLENLRVVAVNWIVDYCGQTRSCLCHGRKCIFLERILNSSLQAWYSSMSWKS